MGSIHPSEHYLLCDRTTQEAARLNVQSDVIKILRSNQILSPLIPKSSVRSVADIATGTGIWLRDVAQELHSQPGPGDSNKELELVGFDISAAQFPPQWKETNEIGKAETRFELADINKGFAEEWWGKFDVVHLRLLIVALTVEKIENAVRNVLTLLKPGGYLQWSEFCWPLPASAYYPSPLTPYGEQKLSYYASQNWSLQFITHLQRILKGFPMEDVQVRDYFQDNFEIPELQGLLVEWQRQTLPALLRPMMRRQGKTEVEVEAVVDDYVRLLEGVGKNGVVLPMPLVTLTARKGGSESATLKEISQKHEYMHENKKEQYGVLLRIWKWLCKAA